MAPSDFSTMADCEPIPELRDRIQADLRIKGQVSCPQQVDMRAIIPVYDFSPTQNRVPGASRRYGYDIGALAVGLCPLIAEELIYYNDLQIRHFLVQLELDIAGRAAIVAAGESIVMDLNYVHEGEIIVVSRQRTSVSAAVGAGCIVNYGIGVENTGATTNRYPMPIVFSRPGILVATDSKIQYSVSVYLGTGANFPANSIVEYKSCYDYIGTYVPLAILP